MEKRAFMIQTLQEALICLSDIRGELYEVTTDDYRQYDAVCNGLDLMIERLQGMGDEQFSHAYSRLQAFKI